MTKHLNFIWIIISLLPRTSYAWLQQSVNKKNFVYQSLAIEIFFKKISVQEAWKICRMCWFIFRRNTLIYRSFIRTLGQRLMTFVAECFHHHLSVIKRDWFCSFFFENLTTEFVRQKSRWLNVLCCLYAQYLPL